VVSGHPDKARRIAAENGLPPDAIYSYETYDRIVHDPRIHIVYVVLPNSMHAEYTIRALKAGKHVLCEKPMATSIADAEAMIAAAKAADRKLMIAYRCHYEPTSLEAMRRMRSGAMGRPRLVVTDMGRQASLSDPSDVWRLDMKMSGGGALADMGIYGVNASRYLLNEEPVEVRAWANTDRNDPRFRTVEDFISWQFRFPSGAIGEGATGFSYAATMAFRAYCEQGKLSADPGCFYGGNRLVVQDGKGETAMPTAEGDQFAREMDWMADVVRGRAPMVSPGEEGLQDMRLMKAIMDSLANNGAPVRTDWGYRRAVDPAAVVDPPRPA
jgi:predicted dehydrogenase